MEFAMPRRDASISIRTKPWVREAMLKIAAAEERSVSWLLERVIADWLKDKGYSETENGAVPVRDRKRTGPRTN